MAELDLRVRLLGKALRATSITGRTDEQIVRAQRRPVGHNPVVDLLLGGLPPGLDVREDTAAGAAASRCGCTAPRGWAGSCRWWC